MPGGGGHWLMHTIHCLQHNIASVLLPTNGDKYDFTAAQTEDAIKAHFANEFGTSDNITLLSTLNLFNIGTTNLTKNPECISELSNAEIFVKFTNDAEYQMQPNEYNTNITLDHDWIYNDRERFLYEFYNVLDNHNIKYKKNDSTVTDSIKNYIKSNAPVSEHFENYSSVFWLGWCHAVLMLSDTCINEDLSKCSVNEIGEILKPFNTKCVSEIRKFIIPSTLNE
jgi:hypothetical protein